MDNLRRIIGTDYSQPLILAYSNKKKKSYRPTAEEEEWVVSVFPDMKNREIADRLGTSESTVIRIARRHGVSKSREFMAKTHRNAVKIAAVKNSMNPPNRGPVPGREKGYFKKGVSYEMRYGHEAEKERVRKSIASLQKTRESEKRRLDFGLPQKTKMKITRQPTRKLKLKWYLKKRGYILDEGLGVAYYNENTRRGKIIEAKDQPWYRFMVEPKNETKNEPE